MKNITKIDIQKIYQTPFIQLIAKAAQVHQDQFPANEIQPSLLLSIKTGGCPENCSYCPQSAHYKSDLQKEKFMAKEDVIEKAKQAKIKGATRFCMGTAWREVRDGDEFDQICKMVESISQLNLEVCCTLGMLTENQAIKLKKHGLDYYNHNIDTSPEYYEKIVTTRSFQDRLDTLSNVRSAHLKVCTGGIIGMGESDDDRISFIHQLVNMSPLPESITINSLIKIPETPLANTPDLHPFVLAQVIATIRILAPQTMIRLSAGRTSLSDESQFLCFLSGANSIFIGEKLLTAPNPNHAKDISLLKRCGLNLKNESNQVELN